MKNIKSFERFSAKMNESITGQDVSSIDRLKSRYPNGLEMPFAVTSEGKNSFANGIDTINPANPKIMEIVEIISDFLNGTEQGDINVVVEGGASNVGSSSGYDNTKLAERRRNNLMDFLKKKFPAEFRLKLTLGKAKVGSADKKDSVQAQKEQFVSASISGMKTMNVQIVGVQGDNTNVYKPDLNLFPKFDPKNPNDLSKFKRVCVKVPLSKLDKFKITLNKFKTENHLPRIDFSIKDYS
jgi:hypothetical protein